MSQPVDLYGTTYGSFFESVLQEVRAEAYGVDIGQNSWLTVDEYNRFLKYLELKPTSHVLDIACGSGGPTLFMARTLGCRVTGIDINEDGIAAANKMAVEQQANSLVNFQYGDASQALPFEDQTFDAAVCIDSINHLAGRQKVLGEWRRILKPKGRLLFTDPIILTGLISNEEVTVRSSIGHFIFAPPGEDDRLIGSAGLELLFREDVTENTVRVSKRRYDARSKRRARLIQIEGEVAFEGQQEFLSMVHKLASERRLSRFAFLSRK